LSRDLRVRQEEIEEEIVLIDKQADKTNRLLESFSELDREKKVLLRFEEAVKETASRGRAAVAARDKAKQSVDQYTKELTRREQAGPMKGIIMRPAAEIRADLVRAEAEATSQDEAAGQLNLSGLLTTCVTTRTRRQGR
jgi:hypothetical protein